MRQGASRDAQSEGTSEITRDSLLRGRVTLLQPRRGFRSSLDPVLLAGFLQPPFGHFLDIGCGTGALAFLLLARDARATGVGVEIQPRLADLAERGIEVNHLAGRFALERGDIRELARSGQWSTGFDLVATNPPFLAVGQGVLPPDQERAIAHHELKLGLGDWLDQAAALCRPEGRVAAIFPAARIDELLLGLAHRGFAPTRVRLVYPRLGQPASRVLIEARRQLEAGDARFEAPLYLHEADGYSVEVRGFLGETQPLALGDKEPPA